MVSETEHSKLEAVCRERDEAYEERFVLVGEVEALRERLGDREQDLKIEHQRAERLRAKLGAHDSDLVSAYERGFTDAVEMLRELTVALPEDWIERARDAASVTDPAAFREGDR